MESHSVDEIWRIRLRRKRRH